MKYKTYKKVEIPTFDFYPYNAVPGYTYHSTKNDIKGKPLYLIYTEDATGRYYVFLNTRRDRACVCSKWGLLMGYSRDSLPALEAFIANLNQVALMEQQSVLWKLPTYHFYNEGTGAIIKAEGRTRNEMMKVLGTQSQTFSNMVMNGSTANGWVLRKD